MEPEELEALTDEELDGRCRPVALAVARTLLRNLPQEEAEQYLGLLKKALSGTLGKNLIDIVFSTRQVVDSEEHRLLSALREHVEALGFPLFTISAAAHQGTRELVFAVANKLKELPPVAVYAPEYVKRPPKVDMSQPLEITVEDNVYLVEGPWLQRLIANVNFGDYESRNWFDQKLRQAGLFAKLEELGIKDGDIVSLYDLEFEYQR